MGNPGYEADLYPGGDIGISTDGSGGGGGFNEERGCLRPSRPRRGEMRITRRGNPINATGFGTKEVGLQRRTRGRAGILSRFKGRKNLR